MSEFHRVFFFISAVLIPTDSKDTFQCDMRIIGQMTFAVKKEVTIKDECRMGIRTVGMMANS